MAKVENKPAPAPEPEKGQEATKETPPESQNQAPPVGAPAPEGEKTQAKAPEAPKAPENPRLPATERPYLDSPRPFGIHHGGLLHTFMKGKTKLTVEQAAWLKEHPYVADNGAEVVE